MKGFSVAEARARFSDLLDQAEHGDPVIVERRGVRFSITAETSIAAASDEPFFEWVDPAVIAGDWTWTTTKRGLTFKDRRPRKAR